MPTSNASTEYPVATSSGDDRPEQFTFYRQEEGDVQFEWRQG